MECKGVTCSYGTGRVKVGRPSPQVSSNHGRGPFQKPPSHIQLSAFSIGFKCVRTSLFYTQYLDFTERLRSSVLIASQASSDRKTPLHAFSGNWCRKKCFTLFQAFLRGFSSADMARPTRGTCGGAFVVAQGLTGPLLLEAGHRRSDTPLYGNNMGPSTFAR